MSRPCACLAALALALSCWLVAFRPALAATPPPPASVGSVGSAPPTASAPAGPPAPSLPDPKELAGEVFNQVLVNLVQGLNSALHGFINGVVGSSFNVISQTPPAVSYQDGVVRQLWGAVRTIANAGLALVALVAGFNLMARQHLGAPSHEAMEVLSRLVLGVLLVNTSLAWCQLLIDTNNALSQAIGQTGLPSWQSADGSSQLLATVIAILLYLVMSLLLLIQMFIRLALVDVLIVIAPIALLCWVLPQTQNWARLWSSTFTGAVMVQFVQVAALKLGGALMIDLGSTAGDVKLLNLFLGVALLALTLKIPGLMRGQLGDGLGFARFFGYRQAAHALEGGGAGGGGKGRGAGTGAAKGGS